MDLENTSQENKESSGEAVSAPDNLSKKELFRAFDKLKGEIFSCRNSLNQLNNDKEKWYQKKEALSKDIRARISPIKGAREKRDSFTKRIKDLKEQRTKLNEEIKKKVSDALKLGKEAEDLAKKTKARNPHGLKRDIDGIELKLETEDMPFDKEKELSKKLKILKKTLGESAEFMNATSKVRKINSEISTLRKSSYAVHNEVRKLAEEGQKLHESIVEESKSIDALKAQEEESFKNFSNFRKSFHEANDLLKEKLKDMDDIRVKINRFNLEESEKRKLHEDSLIKNKEQELEEKIRMGKKITTEDFLVFQESLKKKRF